MAKQLAVAVQCTTKSKIESLAGTIGDSNVNHRRHRQLHSGSHFPIVLKGDGSGVGTHVTFDFGKEVGGFTSIDFGATSSSLTAGVDLAWSESTFYLSRSDNSNGGGGADGVLHTNPVSNGSWTASGGQLRGGFRYFTVSLGAGAATTDTVAISGVSLRFTAAPAWGPNPSKYLNHFHSSDPMVNRVW
jgi:hypothetical protein